MSDNLFAYCESNPIFNADNGEVFAIFKKGKKKNKHENKNARRQCDQSGEKINKI
ncbi:MAG: hypothetical protein ABF449_13505 [Ethanoligenens sp.]